MERLDVKVYPDGYPYISKGILHHSNASVRIARFAKNYRLRDVQYSILIISDDRNFGNVEAAMDNIANTIVSAPSTAFKRMGLRYQP